MTQFRSIEWLDHGALRLLDQRLLPHQTVYNEYTNAGEVAEAIGAVGILAVECFVVDGEVLLNEIAPRPHNSGHWTIDGAVTSQFENHLRAVLDWPLGSTEPSWPAVTMFNLIPGDPPVDPRDRVASALQADVRVHL